jgi:hypothetical protein
MFKIIFWNRQHFFCCHLLHKLSLNLRTVYAQRSRSKLGWYGEGLTRGIACLTETCSTRWAKWSAPQTYIIMANLPSNRFTLTRNISGLPRAINAFLSYRSQLLPNVYINEKRWECLKGMSSHRTSIQLFQSAQVYRLLQARSSCLLNHKENVFVLSVRS